MPSHELHLAVLDAYRKNVFAIEKAETKGTSQDFEKAIQTESNL
jgi:hypothetical protein